MKTMHLLLAFWLLGLAFPAHSRHLMGGYMTYGPDLQTANLWQFKLVLFRDVQSGGASFDNPIDIAIYEKMPDGSHQIFSQFQANFDILEPIQLPTINCGTGHAPFFQEKATYRFSATLPQNANDFVIIHQRCCRPESVVNLVAPGNFGFTGFVTLTGEARATKNTAPDWESTFQPVLCIHEPSVVNFQATEPDGDDLEYRFCPLISGGGPILTPPDLTSCFGAIPRPPCPPPFDTLAFLPGFSTNTPIGDASPYNFNVFGIWQTTPKTIGTFAYAICVTEKRNGVILSETRFEYQIAVTDGLISAPDAAKSTSLALFPNPIRSGEKLKVSGFENLPFSLIINDLSGKTLLAREVAPDEKEGVAVGSLPEGQYFVRCISGGKILSGKLMVE